MSKKDRIAKRLPGGLHLVCALHKGKYQGVLRQDQLGEIKRITADSLEDVENQLTVFASSEAVIADAKTIVKKKHQERLESGGLSGAGYIDGPVKKERQTHCYVCKKKIDNIVDLVCRSCGWIICSRDGACGCGYERKAC